MLHQRRFAADPPRRVLALGSPGSGRAKLVNQIALRYAIPIISLDHERNALGGDPSAWSRRLAELAQLDRWAMMGNDPEIRRAPVSRADWIVFLDMPVTSCVLRVLRSAFGGRESAVDIEAGLWAALREAWRFPTDIAPQVAQMIERERRNRTIFILRSGRDIARFLAQLPEADGSGPSSEEKAAPLP